jgi:hypothetical protein
MHWSRVLSTLMLGAAAAAMGQVTWQTMYGPVSDPGDKWNRIGTDGTTLFCVFHQEWEQEGKFYRYYFLPESPADGWWLMMSDPPRPMSVPWAGGVSAELAYQDGYLYGHASTTNHPGGDWARTFVRYHIDWDEWEVLTDPVNPEYDLVGTPSSGNALFMDPDNPGVGISVWHAGNWWVQFDWNNQTYDNAWMDTGNDLAAEGVPDASWVSRNEDVATDGNGTYYATKNDWTTGQSAGDIIYTWTGAAKGTRVHKLAAKPAEWQAGYGQSIEYIPANLSPSGHPELWLIRGSTGDVSHEGWGDPTDDWARLDLVTLTWVTGKLPGMVRFTGEIVRVGTTVFVRGVDDLWFVAMLEGTPVGSVSGTVTLRHFGNPAGQTANLELREPGTTTVLFSYPIVLDASGGYQVAEVPSGTYDLALKFPHFLRSVIPSKLITTGSNNADFVQINGDANGDNEVGPDDVTAVLNAFGKANQPADLNGSGKVDIYDLNVALINCGQSGAP